MNPNLHIRNGRGDTLDIMDSSSVLWIVAAPDDDCSEMGTEEIIDKSEG